MSEILHKEIDLIQNCITRMANNSFLLKGWAISLIAVILTINTQSASKYANLILVTPIIFFWYLDAYYLRMERLYRKMYQDVLEKRGNHDMSNLYDLDLSRLQDSEKCVLFTMKSNSLIIFYGFLILFNLIFIFIFILK